MPFPQNKPLVELAQNVSHLAGQQNLYRCHGQPLQQPYVLTYKGFNYAFP